MFHLSRCANQRREHKLCSLPWFLSQQVYIKHDGFINQVECSDLSLFASQNITLRVLSIIKCFISTIVLLISHDSRMPVTKLYLHKQTSGENHAHLEVHRHRIHFAELQRCKNHFFSNAGIPGFSRRNSFHLMQLPLCCLVYFYFTNRLIVTV